MSPPLGGRDPHAGFVTRFVGFLIDTVLIAVLFTLGGFVLAYVLSIFLDHGVAFQGRRSYGIAYALWAFVYCAGSLAATSHTPGMALIGTRAVRKDGSHLGVGRSILRVLFFPLSFILFGLPFVLILLRRDRRALHDLLAGTAAVYSWTGEPVADAIAAPAAASPAQAP